MQKVINILQRESDLIGVFISMKDWLRRTNTERDNPTHYRFMLNSAFETISIELVENLEITFELISDLQLDPARNQRTTARLCEFSV